MREKPGEGYAAEEAPDLASMSPPQSAPSRWRAAGAVVGRSGLQEVLLRTTHKKDSDYRKHREDAAAGPFLHGSRPVLVLNTSRQSSHVTLLCPNQASPHDRARTRIERAPALIGCIGWRARSVQGFPRQGRNE